MLTTFSSLWVYPKRTDQDGACRVGSLEVSRTVVDETGSHKAGRSSLNATVGAMNKREVTLRFWIVHLRRAVISWLLAIIMVSIWTYLVLIFAVWMLSSMNTPGIDNPPSFLGIAGYVWEVAMIAVIGVSSGVVPATKLSRRIVSASDAMP